MAMCLATSCASSNEVRWINILLYFLLVYVNAVQAADMTDMSNLRNIILRNYDPHSRPVKNHKDAVWVWIGFGFQGLELDESRNLFTVHGIMYTSWFDDHVKWNPAEYRNLTSLTFADNELWKPDLAVYNNFGGSQIDPFGKTGYWAWYDSYISWNPPSSFQVGCQLDLKLWPFDTQTCYVKIGSWTHDGEQISLFIGGENMTETELLHWDFVQQNYSEIISRNREWKLISTKLKLNTIIYVCCPEPYYDVTLTFSIQRQGSTHIATIVAVAFGIAGAILVSFWLSPHANERMPLILVTFMLNVLSLHMVYKVISSNGSELPLVVAYYRDSLVMVTFDIVWTVFLRYLARTKRVSAVPLPPLVSSFLDSWGATLLCLNPRPKTEKRPPESSLSETDDEKELVKGTNQLQEDWAWLAHLLDRCMFMIYGIIYICFFVAFF